MRKEAYHQTIFNRFIRQTDLVGAFELKQAIGKDSLPFTSVKKHQVAGLMATQKKGFTWKLSDADPREKPFDCFKTPPMPGYVVIIWTRSITFIRIEKFMQERGAGWGGRKSLTKDRAHEIAEKIILK